MSKWDLLCSCRNQFIPGLHFVCSGLIQPWISFINMCIVSERDLLYRVFCKRVFNLPGVYTWNLFHCAWIKFSKYMHCMSSWLIHIEFRVYSMLVLPSRNLLKHHKRHSCINMPGVSERFSFLCNWCQFIFSVYSMCCWILWTGSYPFILCQLCGWNILDQSIR